MIRAHSFARDSARTGFQFYQQLLRSGISSDALSATAAVNCCAKIESLYSGMQVHARIWKDGFLSNARLLTTLMELYSSSEKADDACKVFDEMSDRDVVSFNVLMSCYTHNGRTRDALTLFDEMMNSKQCRPDDVTCLLALQACGSLNSFQWGTKIHNCIQGQGLSSRKVCNSLISIYSRCGSIQNAFDVFNQLDYRDIISWTAMISGLATNGYGRDAIAAFKQMQKQGISPTDHIFTALLSACSHSGLIEEGRMFFQSMIQDFKVTLNIHHYGCMVDLLGHSGFLHEAYELIRSMKIKPDAIMWRILLGACKVHNTVILGEQVAEHLVELKAEEGGNYILLLNIYSSSGDSEKVVELRKMMKERGIHTSPASSSIELKGEVHEFLANDFSHPRSKETYEMLAEINQQLRIAGYVAEVASELHSVGSEIETYTYSYHSEKLAIAFGILSTPPGTTIRVAKDLRICVDCHNFCKVLSAVYNRKVVVRDRNRFHHFRDGRCSCNNYW